MVEEAYSHGQFQVSVLDFSVLCGVGSFGKMWAIILGGIIIKNVSHAKTMMASQGDGFN